MNGTLKNRKIIITVISILLLFLLQVEIKSHSPSSSHEEINKQLVTTRNGLIAAIYSASEGDTIYVGDINFNDFSAGAHIIPSLKRVSVNKSITVKSGKADGSKAVLSGGSFIIEGPILEKQSINCVFEDIIFDGGINTDTLTSEDWESDDGEPEPYKSQYAASFKGNVSAVFSNCDFTRYMYEYGGAIWGSYGNYDWTQPGDFLYSHRDNKFCSLSISLVDCSFTENSAYYAGGAVYLDGENISLSAENCRFEKNNSSVGCYENETGYVGWYGEGGGAVFIRESKATLYNCDITSNTGNRIYGSASQDSTKGGGIVCLNGILNMTDCRINENTASVGGGIYLCNTESMIDGCTISGNSASTEAEVYIEKLVFDEETGTYMDKITDELYVGLVSNLGFAGGIYVEAYGPVNVTFLNTNIIKNSAQNAYGGFYTYYTDWFDPFDGFGSVSFIFCTYADNRCDFNYDAYDGILWAAIPGDIWEIPHVTYFGCVISDETFTSDYPRYEKPEEANGYTYFASPKQAEADGMIKNSESQPVYEIPSSVLKSIFDGRFKDSIGQFYSGRNYNPSVILRLDAAGGGETDEEVVYSYGKTVILPEPVKKKYTFDGWYDSGGMAFQADSLMFGVDVTDYNLYAKWTASAQGNNSPVLWGIFLVSFGAVMLTGIGVFVVLRRRKYLSAEENVTTVSPDSISMPTDELDDFVRLYHLTAREKEIASLLLEGKTQKTIADELFISVETVKTHVKNLYDKVDVKSKYELFAKFKK